MHGQTFCFHGQPIDNRLKDKKEKEEKDGENDEEEEVDGQKTKRSKSIQ